MAPETFDLLMERLDRIGAAVESVADATERIAASLYRIGCVIEDSSRFAEANTLTLCETLRDLAEEYGRARK